MLRLFLNQNLYLAYFFGLIATALWMEVRRHVRIGTVSGGVEATVLRGEASMGKIHGAFALIAIINLTMASAVFPFLPTRITRFAFTMLLIETLAWAYLIYWNGTVRNWLLGLAGAAAPDR